MQRESLIHITLGETILQKSVKGSLDTREELAKIAGVSHDTIHKMKVIEEQAPEEVKERTEIPIIHDPI